MPVAVAYNIISNSYSTSTLNSIVADSSKDNVSFKFVRSLLQDLITSEDSAYNKYFRSNKRFKIPKAPTEQRCQKSCHISEAQFIPGDVKVVDHDHFTGAFRGIAHHFSDISCKKPTFIPIMAHNSSKYDTHLYVKELSEIDDPYSTVIY